MTPATSTERTGGRWPPHESPRPAGPRGPRLLLGMLAGRDLPGLFGHAAQRYGTRWLLRLPERDWLVTAEPSDAGALVAAGPETVRGGDANAALRPVSGGHSVVALDGPDHRRARRLLLPPFHGDGIRAYLEDVEELTDAMIESWNGRASVNVYAAARRLAFHVIVRTVLGIRDPHRADELLARVQRLFGGAALVIHVPALQRDLGPLSPWRRFVALRARADELIYREIRERRMLDDVGERDDVLSMLLRVRDEGGNALSDEELRDHVMTLASAGHETIAAAIAWIVDALLRHPEALGRLRDELRGDGETYLDAVIHEGLRLHPPVPMFGRAAARPFRVGAYTVPRGVGVLVNVWSMHRRPDLFPDPERFVPERFLEGEPPRHAYLPFGGGVRRCLGGAFAEQELKVVLRRVLTRCELELVSRRPEGSRLRGVTIVPARGVRTKATELV